MIHIYCDGGLGNRLLAMFSALYFAKQSNKPFTIHWPSNNWCGCNFWDLFEPQYNVTNYNLQTVDDIIHNHALLVHELQIRHKPSRVVINTGMSKDSILQQLIHSENVLYYGNSMHSCLTKEDLIPVIQDLKITKSILENIKPYIQNRDAYFGVHIRGTDFPEQPLITTTQLHSEMNSNPQNTYFVCSDQKSIEDSFKLAHTNVVVLEKSNYVELLDKTKGWNGRIVDDLNRSFNFNVNRNKLSVVEAFCDMLVLSQTRMLKTSNSSFLTCAYIMSKGIKL